MINLNVEFERPFGPSILVSKCPDDILQSLNNYVDEIEKDENLKSIVSSKSGNIPDLLERNLENIYLTEKKCEEIGLKELVEFLGNYYVQNNTHHPKGMEISELKLGIIPEDVKFKFCHEYLYADCWINRYYAGDYTPMHIHGSNLAGIILLKIPREIESNENTDIMHGKLQFVCGHESIFCNNMWTPYQEDGIIMLFPSWLNHLVYPQKTNQERRTLSFNLISDDQYYYIKEEILGGSDGFS